MLDPDAIAANYWSVLRQPRRRLDVGNGNVTLAGKILVRRTEPREAHAPDLFFCLRAIEQAVKRNEFVDKIKFACRARDETDKDFVVIARTDTSG